MLLLVLLALQSAVPKNAFWEAGLKQGMDGFNAVTKGFLSSCPDWKSPSSGNVDLLPQQRVVATLVHPQSPVARLLADHNTGSGKTLVIIRVLDDFYFDKRAKIAVFPKDVVVDNFYLGLVEWPSRGRDYLCVQNRWLARIASERDEWKSARHLRWRISMLNKRIAQKVEAEREVVTAPFESCGRGCNRVPHVPLNYAALA